jgi:hypothetical protein
MEYIKCPYCGSDTPEVLYRCKNCQKVIMNHKTETPIESTKVSDDVSMPKEKKNGFTKYVFGIIVIAVIFAVIKNPSVTESKQQIKDAAISQINKKFGKNIADDKEVLGSVIGMFMVPTLFDKFVSIDVTDYVLFSSFKATLNYDDKKRNLSSGIILFGNIIPFSSDINENVSDFESNDSDSGS